MKYLFDSLLFIYYFHSFIHPSFSLSPLSYPLLIFLFDSWLSSLSPFHSASRFYSISLSTSSSLYSKLANISSNFLSIFLNIAVDTNVMHVLHPTTPILEGYSWVFINLVQFYSLFIRKITSNLTPTQGILNCHRVLVCRLVDR